MESWRVKKHMHTKFAALTKRNRGSTPKNLSFATMLAVHENTMDVMTAQISFGIYNAIRAHFDKEFDVTPPGSDAMPEGFNTKFLEYTSVYFQLAYEYTRRELAKVVPAVAPAAMTVVIEEEN